MKATTALCFGLALVVLAGCGEDSESTGLGKQAPDLQVESLAKPGTNVSPRDLKGNVVLLDFWATWCGPCKAFMPKLESMYQQYHSKGFEVMSISDETRDKVEAFRKTVPYTFPAYLDNFQLLSKAFNVDAIPHIVLIDRSGTVIYDGAGDSDDVDAELKQDIEKALG